MIANYHTHTTRCGHATGTDRTYIETAIAAGIKTLGFSEHVPYPFPDGYESGYRMKRAVLPEYLETMLAFREEYKNQIQLLIGFEAEYYPLFFDDLVRELTPYPYDYLILGQHFLANEIEPSSQYSGGTHDDPVRLRRYVDAVVCGLETGCFTYLAHPDVTCYTGDDAIYDREMGRICETLARLDIPAEINMYGCADGRCYPTVRFFRLAASYGCRAIIGCDAHVPSMLNNQPVYNRCRALAEEVGIELLDTVPLKNAKQYRVV